MTEPFVHLNVHTEYSIVDGLCKIGQLYQAAANSGMRALAVTDHNNLFGLVKCVQAAKKAGVKPIVGASVCLYDPESEQLSEVILLAKDNQGYRHLTQLVSQCHLQPAHPKEPSISFESLQKAHLGLIVISPALRGDVAIALSAHDHSTARQRALRWQTTFGDRFYCELLRIDHPKVQTAAMQKLAGQLGLPVVATNAVRFLRADDFEAHEARVCIHSGYLLSDPKRDHDYTPEQYLKSTEQMQALFSDCQAAIINASELAKRCTVTLTFDQTYLPHYPIPQGYQTDSYLAHLSSQGLAKRLKVSAENIPEHYQQRLEYELNMINKMGFAGYFLIVADFIQWAKAKGIPVGPGRGSGAGSLVAYVTAITDLDPLEYELLFERFLNPERVSMPDFDVDFCMQNRDRVIDYVAEKYGRDAVAQIITFGTMAAKAVIRDVGRVLGHPYPWVDRIAKLIPFTLGVTLDQALAEEEAFRQAYNEDEEVRELVDLAKKLEGITRNAGKHAGGVVMAPSVMTDFAPLYCEAPGAQAVTQFDKDDIESIGLVKFDFLGLKTLTIIQQAVDLINQLNHSDLKIAEIPLDDTKTFDLLKACKTTAVFQLESRGMKDIIKRLQPDCFEEIIALVALFRPGPLQSGMVDDFIDRKHGRAKIEYPHAALTAILKPTYGVILYQEQVMQIAQVLAGYTLGGADILRRAMGKKKPEEMAKQRKVFVKGSKKNNISEKLAHDIYDLIEKFAGYGFNKSHSAAYALVAYQTAWLKAHYPAPFMAAVLSADLQNTDKVVIFIEECRAMGLTVSSPDIHRSHWGFTVDNNEIIYGLGAIKGVGEGAIESIFNARQQQGAFKDFYAFCQVIDLKKANRRTLEALILSGTLDVFGERASLIASIEKATYAAESVRAQTASGQGDIFQDVGIQTHDHQLVIAPAMSKHDRLAGEKATLGFYLSGHPIDRYLPEITQFCSKRLNEITPQSQSVMVAGLLQQVRPIRTKQNKKMAIISLDDASSRMDITLFPEEYELSKDLLHPEQLIVAEGQADLDPFNNRVRLTAKRIMTLDKARNRFARQLVIKVTPQQLTEETINQLKQLLLPYRHGSVAIHLQVDHEKGCQTFQLGEQWRVQLSDELINHIESLFNQKNVAVLYSHSVNA